MESWLYLKKSTALHLQDAGKAADIIDDATDSYKVISEGLCFVEGTLVHTESGLQEIEKIQTNDYVWAWNEKTETVAAVLYT